MTPIVASKKTAVIVQPNYIPWKGYFRLIAQCDTFIFLDDVQYTHRDWRNRNTIKTKDGIQWLTIQVISSFHKKFCDIQVVDSSWRQIHFQRICHAYAKAPFFKEVRDFIESLYLDSHETFLSEINQIFTNAICDFIQLKKPTFLVSSTIHSQGSKTSRLVSLLESVQASDYLSGPSAKGYLDEDLIAQSHINLHYVNYDNFTIYPQLHSKFEHHVSIIDLLFNVGSHALEFILPSPSEHSQRLVA